MVQPMGGRLRQAESAPALIGPGGPAKSASPANHPQWWLQTQPPTTPVVTLITRCLPTQFGCQRPPSLQARR